MARINIQKIAMRAAGLGLGGVAAGFMEKGLANVAIDDKIKKILPIGVGALFLTRPGQFVNDIGAGMIARGAGQLLTEFGVGGIPTMLGNVDTMYMDPGYADQRTVGGAPGEELSY